MLLAGCNAQALKVGSPGECRDAAIRRGQHRERVGCLKQSPLCSSVGASSARETSCRVPIAPESLNLLNLRLPPPEVVRRFISP